MAQIVENSKNIRRVNFLDNTTEGKLLNQHQNEQQLNQQKTIFNDDEETLIEDI